MESLQNESVAVSDLTGAALIMPKIAFGLGTASFKGKAHNYDDSDLFEEIVEQAVSALETGFRHIDLAEMYGNDRECKKALKVFFDRNPSVERGQIWITSKLSDGMADPVEGCKKIIERLDCHYLDLLLLHCPVEFQRLSNPSITIPDITEIWRGMEQLVQMGLVRNIGVSNYRISDLEELLAVCQIPPFINQVEFNPYLQQRELREFCISHSIPMAAYSPLGPINLFPGGPIDPILDQLAAKHNTTPGTILLKYAMQMGYCAITTTSKKERQIEYLASASSSTGVLDEEDINLISTEGESQQRRKYFAQYFNS
jgi:diketogulonate reductase-like aldo/keto reductase